MWMSALVFVFRSSLRISGLSRSGFGGIKHLLRGQIPDAVVSAS
jgi:hypothetical protein